MKSTISLNQSYPFSVIGTHYIETSGETKLKFAIEKVLKSFKDSKLQDLFNDDRRSTEIMNGAVDEKGCRIFDLVKETIDTAKGPVEVEKEVIKYTPVGQVALEKELRGLSDKEYPFKAYLCTDIPVLSNEQIKAFRGIVIPEDYENTTENSVDDIIVCEPKTKVKNTKKK